MRRRLPELLAGMFAVVCITFAAARMLGYFVGGWFDWGIGLVREGFVVPPNSLVLGVPGRIVRETTIQERDRISKTVDAYIDLQQRYR